MLIISIYNIYVSNSIDFASYLVETWEESDGRNGVDSVLKATDSLFPGFQLYTFGRATVQT